MTKTASANTKTPSAFAPHEATTVLTADHQKVTALFNEYEKARTSRQKKELVQQICTELTVHAQIEEEIFYPAVKKALKDSELVPEAKVEHATIKDLIAQIQDGEPDAEMLDAKVKVLSEYVAHHVKEEQNRMFPAAEGTKLDMLALGEQLVNRKDELMAEFV